MIKTIRLPLAAWNEQQRLDNINASRDIRGIQNKFGAVLSRYDRCWIRGKMATKRKGLCFSNQLHKEMF